MVGEGEETFKELAGYYVEKNPQDLKDMTESVTETEIRSYIMDGARLWT